MATENTEEEAGGEHLNYS